MKINRQPSNKWIETFLGWEIGEHLDDMTVYDEVVLLCSYGGGGNWRWWMETALQELLV